VWRRGGVERKKGRATVRERRMGKNDGQRGEAR